MVGESPRKFESPIVIIDPIDRNRNLGAAISIQNVTNFILIARNFLKKSSISYFKEKSRIKIPAEIAKNMLIVNFTYKKRSDDIIYGQIKRASSSIQSQMIKEGFNVLRNDSVAYDETKASLLFLLESLTISKNKTRTGPDVFSGDFSTKFININSKKSKLMWADKEGKLQSLQTRRYENAKSYLSDLIKNHIGDSGIPKGLKTDFKTGFKITSGKDKQNKSVKKSISKLITTDDTAFSTN
jgi:tRNA nucleotidyltransferase (CCA-adding enzyme)